MQHHRISYIHTDTEVRMCWRKSYTGYRKHAQYLLPYMNSHIVFCNNDSNRHTAVRIQVFTLICENNHQGMVWYASLMQIKFYYFVYIGSFGTIKINLCFRIILIMNKLTYAYGKHYIHVHFIRNAPRNVCTMLTATHRKQ